MDIWKYYDITHKKHIICNPMSKYKIDRKAPKSWTLVVVKGNS
jgi:hypothetical protein